MANALIINQSKTLLRHFSLSVVLRNLVKTLYLGNEPINCLYYASYNLFGLHGCFCGLISRKTKLVYSHSLVHWQGHRS